MDELQKRYFENNTENPYQQGGSTGPNPPSQQPPTLNDNRYYWQSIKYDNMVIVAILAAFYFLNMTAQSIIMVIQIIIGGGLDPLLNDLASGELTLVDYDSIMAQVAGILQNIPGGIGISLIIAEAIALLIFLLIRGKKLFTTDISTTNSKIKFTEFSSLFIIAFGAQFLFTILSFILNMILSLFGMEQSTLMEETMRSLYNPSGFLYIIIFGPIMEEIIFRGAIMRTLEKHGKNYAIVMSSLFFGLFHVFLLQGAFAFLVGLILGYTAMNYSMKWAIALHIMINGVATLMDITLPVTLQLIIFTLVFIGAVLLLVKNNANIKAAIERGRPVIKEVYRIAFSGVFLISAIAVVLFFGILLF